jgi:hypothetical protein
MVVLKMIVTPGSWFSEPRPISLLMRAADSRAATTVFWLVTDTAQLLDDHLSDLGIFQGMRPQHADLIRHPRPLWSAGHVTGLALAEAAARTPLAPGPPLALSVPLPSGLPRGGTRAGTHSVGWYPDAYLSTPASMIASLSRPLLSSYKTERSDAP